MILTFLFQKFLGLFRVMLSLKQYPEKIQERIVLVFLFVAAGALLLFGLGHFPFKDYDEATFAMVAAEMVESDDYIHLTRDGKPWIDKPPLLFWLMGASARLFGFNEFSLRLPGAIIGIAMVFLTYALARFLTSNRNVALLSAFILLTTSHFVYSSREVRFDIPVAFAILLAIYSFVRGWQKPTWYIGVGIGLAAAILFKSFFAIFIPILILTFSFAYHEWKWLKQPFFWLSAFGGLLLAAPWHIAQYRAYGKTFLDTYLGLNGLRRYTDPFLGSANASPWYFFTVAARIIEPWFVIFSLGSLWCIFKRKTLQTWRWYRPLVTTFLCIIIIVGLVSFSKSKLFYYFDPIYPFFAIFIALLFILLRERVSQQANKIYAVMVALFLLGIINTLWQITEFRPWPVGGELTVAQDEYEISRILNAQTESSKLYTLFHPLYDTVRLYTRKRTTPLTIQEFTKQTMEPAAFFLLIPNHALKSMELNPLLAARMETVFNGGYLTMFKVRAVQNQ